MTYRMKNGNFDLETLDSVGYKPDRSLLFSIWTHYSNRKYKILGFSFNGETDRWEIRHQRVTDSQETCDGIDITRTPENFFGLVNRYGIYGDFPRFVGGSLNGSESEYD